MVPTLLATDVVSRSVRRIVGLDLETEDEALGATTRFAVERIEAPPRPQDACTL